MTLSLLVIIPLLVKLGKKYPWPRLSGCLKCGEKVWGHGYVQRFFDGLDEPAWMKRWRCPRCKTIYTMRPLFYWRGFGAPACLIIMSLMEKLLHGTWLPKISRQKQNYWWKGWRIHTHQEDLAPVILPSLESEGLILATHSATRRTVTFFPEPPHRSFSLPPSLGP